MKTIITSILIGIFITLTSAQDYRWSSEVNVTSVNLIQGCYQDESACMVYFNEFLHNGQWISGGVFTMQSTNAKEMYKTFIDAMVNNKKVTIYMGSVSTSYNYRVTGGGCGSSSISKTIFGVSIKNY